MFVLVRARNGTNTSREYGTGQIFRDEVGLKKPTIRFSFMGGVGKVRHE